MQIFILGALGLQNAIAPIINLLLGLPSKTVDQGMGTVYSGGSEHCSKLNGTLVPWSGTGLYPVELPRKHEKACAGVKLAGGGGTAA